jgi:glutamyl-tRNA synthetase
MTKVRTRIAPSPTGIPHLGNTRTALYDYLLAKKYGGKFILRLEDTDQKRLVPEAAEKIYQIFDFLGLVPDESPQKGGPFTPYVQTERLEIYQQYAKQLLDSKSAYRCFCHNREVGKFKKYDKRCLKLSDKEVEEKLAQGEEFVIRINLPTSGWAIWKDLVQGKISIPWEEVDDKVILKSNGIPTYHLAVVVDDHLMEITHVLRGVEWISSTPVHLALYEALNWPLPELAHLPLLLGPDKSKLSKRHGAKNALEYRDDGYLPEAINNFLFYLGFSYKDNSQLLTLEEMVKVFDERKLHKQNAVFDIKKLEYFNKKWIKDLSDKDLATRIFELYSMTEVWDKSWPQSAKEIEKYMPLFKLRITTLADGFNFLKQFYLEPGGDYEAYSGLSLGQFKSLAKLAEETLREQPSWTADSLETALRAQIESENLTASEYFSAIRGAVSGSRVSPPLFDTIVLLGRDKTLARLQAATK